MHCFSPYGDAPSHWCSQWLLLHTWECCLGLLLALSGSCQALGLELGASDTTLCSPKVLLVWETPLCTMPEHSLLIMLALELLISVTCYHPFLKSSADGIYSTSWQSPHSNHLGQQDMCSIGQMRQLRRIYITKVCRLKALIYNILTAHSLCCLHYMYFSADFPLRALCLCKLSSLQLGPQGHFPQTQRSSRAAGDQTNVLIKWSKRKQHMEAGTKLRVWGVLLGLIPNELNSFRIFVIFKCRFYQIRIQGLLVQGGVLPAALRLALLPADCLLPGETGNAGF